ncbi:ABC transporter permease [Cryptosporangium aurantiacum]|uniref:Transport permease protein n=1 Tax=Cryptosporangium aurantiacum TaxID=134849 RepID=A0A1M7RJ63_9ACTN|nr:ABC transporter permease [Cryptosporangium aurantiacum]SHN46220.1 ABC-2 type transport system permease protein [Cryptosporangium aurantiacum]
MSPSLPALRAGLIRGRIELRQMLTTPQDLWNTVLPSLIFVVVLFFTRGSALPGADIALGSRTLPSLVGMTVVSTGVMTMAMSLTIEREDGTLLRAKAVPSGMVGYLVGKIVLVAAMTLVNILIFLVPSVFVLDGLVIGSVSGWLTLSWVLVLGMVAILPLGAILGAMMTNPRTASGALMLPLIGLVAISGIFYPITGYPEWLQTLAHVFPVYWLGLGMRSAMLPDSMAAAESAGSWQHLETFGVLGAWAVAGLIVAPIVLRRMARRESGSSVAARRERVLQRAI